MISRAITVAGLVCILPIGRGLLDGSLTIAAAGERALVLLAALWLLEHTVVPLSHALVGAERRHPTPSASDVAPDADAA